MGYYQLSPHTGHRWRLYDYQQHKQARRKVVDIEGAIWKNCVINIVCPRGPTMVGPEGEKFWNLECARLQAMASAGSKSKWTRILALTNFSLFLKIFYPRKVYHVWNIHILSFQTVRKIQKSVRLNQFNMIWTSEEHNQQQSIFQNKF